MLKISTLGGLSIRRSGEPVTGLASRKAEALLVYLAYTGRPQQREVLAEMFWPERTQERAMANLRVVLSSLRRRVGDDVTTTRDTAALNPEAEMWLDVAELEEKLAAGSVEDAVALYQGGFLEGFSIRGSSGFDNWVTFERERLHRLMLDRLGDAVAQHLATGTYKEGIPHARRLLQLDPLLEDAHCQLMRLLACSGQRAGALAQYAACRQILDVELGVEPAEETSALYEQIRAGEIQVPVPAPGRRAELPPGRPVAVRTLRGYELLEPIGTGGFGEVYRARQPSVGRTVAVKVILPQFANHPDFVRRFEAEAQLVARLEHPHIVPLYDYWREPDGAFLVMRWLPGGNLHASLRRGPWSLEDAADLLDQVSSALALAHRRGVVHCDVKPENVLLDREGNAYLTDFGIAKDLIRATVKTVTGAPAGSLWYISPEQAQGLPITPQSDLYSLGIVMYKVLTGKHPYSEETPAHQLVLRLTEPLPPLKHCNPNLPVSLEEVIQRATALDPMERYAEATAFAVAFREAVSGTQQVTQLARAEKAPSLLPAFLRKEASLEKAPQPIFVARERELARLRGLLEIALGGRGQVVFVTGGPGRGKTTLLQEFARQAMEEEASLLVAGGNCNAYSGMGDPYLPFREMMGMLTGDVEARWAAGAMTGGHAQRLWMALPQAVKALADHGPSLLEVFVPGAALISRAAAAVPGGAPSLQRLRLAMRVQQAPSERLEQGHLFAQYTTVLRELARQHPLFLILDDMQWADAASLSLLFHLGRRLEGSHITIACAYRPEEVALGRDGKRHPLEKVLSEFKRTFGDVWVDLGEAEESEGRRFVNAFLDTEPNRIGEGFRNALHARTRGHPLFTVELLRTMKDRGDLVRDQSEHWVEGQGLDWQTLPARVEGVIEERVGRLEEDHRELLAMAAVEGERFTVQVLARATGIGERRIIRWLADDLGERHRLITDDGVDSFGGQRLHQYRFRHVLFQQFLYQRLSPVKREMLHADLGQALEELHAGRTEKIAVQLARHWLQAAQEKRAIPYLLRAGDQARALYAHAEAERFYRQAVRILRRRGEDEQAARTLMKLGLVFTAAFESEQAQKAYEEAFALWEPLRESWDRPARRLPAAILRFAAEEPPSLDPARIDDDVSAFMATQLFEGLVRIGQDANVLPAVAARWEVADGGMRYLFHLRDGVCWSDGTPLTAGDFEYAWRRNLDPSTGSPLAHLLFPIRNARALAEGGLDNPQELGVAALDDLTVEVCLEAPTAYLPYLLAHPIAYPLPRWAAERQGQTWTEPGELVTNGPYQVIAWEQGKVMALTRNPFYYGSFMGNLEEIECACFSEYGQALESYAADLVDAVSMFNADPGAVARARAIHGDELVLFPRLSTFYLMFRADRPPFDDVRVRRAFVHAVDRETLSAEAFQDPRLPAMGGFVPPGMAGHSPGIGLPHHAERALLLLSEAGYPGGQGFPQVTWFHLQSAKEQRVVAFLRAAWHENLGLDLTPRGMEWGEFLERMASDPAHLTLVGWSADYPDPDSVLRVTFHSKMGVSATGWHNARFDALVEEAGRIPDHARRMALYQEADRILVAEEAAIMPLSYGQGRMLVKPWVTLPPTRSVQMPFKNVVVERG